MYYHESSHLVLTITQWCRYYYYSHFTYKLKNLPLVMKNKNISWLQSYSSFLMAPCKLFWLHLPSSLSHPKLHVHGTIFWIYYIFSCLYTFAHADSSAFPLWISCFPKKSYSFLYLRSIPWLFHHPYLESIDFQRVFQHVPLIHLHVIFPPLYVSTMALSKGPFNNFVCMHVFT